MNCKWCQKKPATDSVGTDGYSVCADCRPAVQAYYDCQYCGQPLPGLLGEHGRKRLERHHCGSEACQLKDDIKYGRVCCEKATKTACVCMYSYVCPDHAPEGRHVGTHD